MQGLPGSWSVRLKGSDFFYVGIMDWGPRNYFGLLSKFHKISIRPGFTPIKSAPHYDDGLNTSAGLFSHLCSNGYLIARSLSAMCSAVTFIRPHLDPVKSDCYNPMKSRITPVNSALGTRYSQLPSLQ
jgi:hypothetical protein